MDLKFLVVLVILFFEEEILFCFGRFCWDLVKFIWCFVYCILVKGCGLKVLKLELVNWFWIEWCKLFKWFLFIFVFLNVMGFCRYFCVLIFIFFDFRGGFMFFGLLIKEGLLDFLNECFWMVLFKLVFKLWYFVVEFFLWCIDGFV